MTRRRRNLSHDLLQALLGNLHTPAILLSCTKSFHKLDVVNDATMLKAFGHTWTGRPDKRAPELAICHVDGIITKVYRDLRWTRSPQSSPTDIAMFSFTGNEATDQAHLLGVSVAAAVKRPGCANPIYYLNC